MPRTPFFGKITVEEMYGMMKPVVQHAHRKALAHCDDVMADVPWFKKAVVAEMEALAKIGDGHSDIPPGQEESAFPEIDWPSAQEVEEVVEKRQEAEAEIQVATYLINHAAMEHPLFEVDRTKSLAFPYHALNHLNGVLAFALTRARSTEKLKTRNNAGTQRRDCTKTEAQMVAKIQVLSNLSEALSAIAKPVEQDPVGDAAGAEEEDKAWKPLQTSIMQHEVDWFIAEFRDHYEDDNAYYRKALQHALECQARMQGAKDSERGREHDHHQPEVASFT